MLLDPIILTRNIDWVILKRKNIRHSLNIRRRKNKNIKIIKIITRDIRTIILEI